MTVAPQAWRRHLRLLLDGLRAPAAQAATALPVPPLTPDQLSGALRALAGHDDVG
ncbi:hypothetical protein V7793_06790 [Streptomyces sp. KLMMK]|uniref:hypothetical protein n=1 Tax=Streptomyces sp. KLMMK TaxID=3109353 RepID=UPI003000F373